MSYRTFPLRFRSSQKIQKCSHKIATIANATGQRIYAQKIGKPQLYIPVLMVRYDNNKNLFFSFAHRVLLAETL